MSTGWIQLDLLNPGHENCHHKTYALSCDQYERLLRRAGGCCEMCGLPGAFNSCERLHIDHDPSIGMWAVRGLLCVWCNRDMAYQSASAVREYLSNPWFASELQRLGVPQWVPEPSADLEVVVTPFGHRWQQREMGLWRRIDSKHVARVGGKTWERFLYFNGPLNLEFRPCSPGVRDVVFRDRRFRANPSEVSA